jgi:2-oxoglutarate dehydrogenase E1 component
MHRDFRKPLIAMTPKSLLRSKKCVSRLADFGPASSFHRVMYCNEIPSPPQDARQVVLCSGKVYYDLLAEREKRATTDVHFLRLEQLYPFPADALGELLAPYRHCHLVWCQEEPRNMGAMRAACRPPLPRRVWPKYTRTNKRRSSPTLSRSARRACGAPRHGAP